MDHIWSFPHPPLQGITLFMSCDDDFVRLKKMSEFLSPHQLYFHPFEIQIDWSTRFWVLTKTWKHQFYPKPRKILGFVSGYALERCFQCNNKLITIQKHQWHHWDIHTFFSVVQYCFVVSTHGHNGISSMPDRSFTMVEVVGVGICPHIIPNILDPQKEQVHATTIVKVSIKNFK
jgi:hypothetical protein